MAMEKPKWVTLPVLMLAVSMIACTRVHDKSMMVGSLEACHSWCNRGLGLCIVELCTWIGMSREYNRCHDTCEQASQLCHEACGSPGSGGGLGGDRAEPPVSSIGVPQA